MPPGQGGQGAAAIDPLAFLVGPVGVNVSETGGASRLANLASFIDRGKRIVRSNSGQLVWDYGRGLVTVDAPRAQGVTGFLSKVETVTLADVDITSGMEYGAVLLVSMDDRPLTSSRKMLLQVMSEDTNLGWSAPGTGLRQIADLGGPPLVIKNFEGRLSLKRPDAASLRVTPLDFNGYRKGASRQVSGKNITLIPTAPYYLIEKP